MVTKIVAISTFVGAIDKPDNYANEANPTENPLGRGLSVRKKG
jgi:hypothetical protein